MWSTEWFETGIAVIFLIPSSSSLLLLLLLWLVAVQQFSVCRENDHLLIEIVFEARPALGEFRKLIIDRLSVMSIHDLSFAAKSSKVSIKSYNSSWFEGTMRKEITI